jgi:hypothetical protein
MMMAAMPLLTDSFLTQVSAVMVAMSLLMDSFLYQVSAVLESLRGREGTPATPSRYMLVHTTECCQILRGFLVGGALAGPYLHTHAMTPASEAGEQSLHP